MKLKEFKKENRPKRQSVLSPFKSQILNLHSSNYSLKSIQAFLKKNGVKTSCVNIHKFIKKEQEQVKTTILDCKKKAQKTEKNERWDVKISNENLILKALKGDAR